MMSAVILFVWIGEFGGFIMGDPTDSVLRHRVFHHMKVDHGGGDVGMAEEVLDSAYVDAAFEEVGGKGMPQRIDTLLINLARLGSPTDFIRFLNTKSG